MIPLLSRNFCNGIIACLLLLPSYLGCTTVYSVPMKKVAYSSEPKINLNVVVVIDEVFKKANWTKELMGDTYVLPLGNVLALNTEGVAQAVFRQTVVVDRSDSLSSSFDATLNPKVIDILRNRPPWVGQDRTTAVIFEWRLKDATGDVIWVDTIIGKGIGPFGKPGNEDSGKEQVENLLDDLFHKSYEAMMAAPEILEFAASHSNQK